MNALLMTPEDLVEMLRAKIGRTIHFTSANPREFAKLKQIAGDETWQVMGQGITRTSIGTVMLFEVLLNLVVYRDRPGQLSFIDKRIDDMINKLQSELPRKPKVRLSVHILNEYDDDDQFRVKCHLELIVEQR